MYDYSDYISKEENFFEALLSNSLYQIIFQWIVLVLLIAILVVAILMFVEIKKGAGSSRKTASGNKNSMAGIVFCKNCGSQCAVEDKVCPRCGAKRI